MFLVIGDFGKSFLLIGAKGRFPGLDLKYQVSEQLSLVGIL